MYKNCLVTDQYMEVQTEDHLLSLSQINFSDIPFISLTKESGSPKNRNLSFNMHKGIAGVYLLKEKESNKIFSLGSGEDLYNRIYCAICRRKRINLFEHAELGVIRSARSLMPKVVNVIRNLHQQAPEKALYEEFKSCILSMNPLPLERLHFRDIYEPQNVRPFFSFRHVNVPGVYIIMENEKIVYVGMGSTQTNKALYKHFERYKKDRETSHYRANYFATRDIFQYQAAVIEIPHGTLKEVLELENYLILYLDPLDNRKGVISEESVIFDVEIPGWKPMEIDGVPIEDLPF